MGLEETSRELICMENGRPTLTWVGSVTVPFGDSSIVAPVSYTFVTAPSGLGGTAMVPGARTTWPLRDCGACFAAAPGV